MFVFGSNSKGFKEFKPFGCQGRIYTSSLYFARAPTVHAFRANQGSICTSLAVGKKCSGTQRVESGISFSLKSLSLLLFSFSMFFVFLSFVSFFLVAAHKKDSFKLRVD